MTPRLILLTVMLVYRHVGFKNESTIVLAYLVHETKRLTSHIQFVRWLKDTCPLFEEKTVLVTDNEQAFETSFREVFPALQQLRCWNHLSKNIRRRKLKEKKQKSVEINDEQNDETDKLN
ncbi:unnamed protein product [Didymodactylos carnosus]|uniref:MULE transposase domain-containing protein n=1 Tax=Didymodactylos carnosus TaxID=1234261 RepID=A0A8S2MW34_9BILA|nr:unnamed protein product [Didymodactylos carnosus]CAF3963900.1 unnamed protein product [Didymodactylos carnosus]